MKSLFYTLALCFLTHSSNATTFNVKKFGAMGDGKTNDRAAIQAAIDSAAQYAVLHHEKKVTVYFPNGVYILKDAVEKFTHPIKKNSMANYTNSLLNIYSNIELLGDKKSIIKVGKGQNKNENCKTFNVVFASDNVSNISIRRLTFDLNGKENMPAEETCLQHTKNAAILITEGNHIRIDSVKIMNNIGRQCISFGGVRKNNLKMIKHIVISNCTFENVGDCVQHDLFQNDHSSIYVMADSAEIFNNNLSCGCESDRATAIECHLSHSKVHHNKIENYNTAFNIVAMVYDQINTTYYENEITNANFGFVIWTTENFIFKNVEIGNNKISINRNSRGNFINHNYKAGGEIENLTVKKNEIKNLQNDGTNITAAIFMFKSKNFLIQDNSFSNFKKNIMLITTLDEENSVMKNNELKNDFGASCNEDAFYKKIIIGNKIAYTQSNNCVY